MKRPFKLRTPSGGGQSFSRLTNATYAANSAIDLRRRTGLPDGVIIIDRETGERWGRDADGVWAAFGVAGA